MAKILAIRTDRFGEFLLIIPALRALKEKFPGVFLSLIVNPHVKELAQHVEFADEVIPWENRRHSLRELWDFSRLLKKKGFAICLIFNPAKELHLLSFLAGIPMRIGYGRKWGILLTHKKADEKQDGDKHEIEYNLELAGLAGAETKDHSLSLNIGDDAMAAFLEKFSLRAVDKFIAIHPWTSDPLKQWELENFRELAQRAERELDLEVFVIGGKEEAQKFPRYFADLGEGILDLTGKTSLCELAALLKLSRVLVSADSGPVHLASCVGTPAIVIFRSDLPGKTSVRWGPRGCGNVVLEAPDLGRITVEEVWEKLKGALKK